MFGKIQGKKKKKNLKIPSTTHDCHSTTTVNTQLSTTFYKENKWYFKIQTCHEIKLLFFYIPVFKKVQL